MIVKGKRYGVKTFIVPLRDPKTFQLLPGINIGDIGMKMGRNGIDNGYVQFTNVRVPRAYMLMKHTQVTREGEPASRPSARGHPGVDRKNSPGLRWPRLQLIRWLGAHGPRLCRALHLGRRQHHSGTPKRPCPHCCYSDAKKERSSPVETPTSTTSKKTLNDKCTGEGQLDTLDGIDQGVGAVAAHAVKKAYEDFEALTKAGRSRDQAFEECSQSRFVAASVHTSGYIFRQFRAAVEQVKEGKDGVRKHLEILCKFYGCGRWKRRLPSSFALVGSQRSCSTRLQAKVTELCAETRKFAIPLVDSFALHDHTINSPFGRYDGAVYTSYWRAVRRNNPQGKHSYWESTIKPFLHREDAEFEDVDEAIGIDEEIEEIKQVRLHVLYLLILPLLYPCRPAQDREEAEAEAKENKEQE
ncbi:hypothetical protein L7F22_047568 [Adiantum nelumboides]|nr:hypothetical protein [Adiantum nelumboides]